MLESVGMVCTPGDDMIEVGSIMPCKAITRKVSNDESLTVPFEGSRTPAAMGNVNCTLLSLSMDRTTLIVRSVVFSIHEAPCNDPIGIDVMTNPVKSFESSVLKPGRCNVIESPGFSIIRDRKENEIFAGESAVKGLQHSAFRGLSI